MRHYKNVRDVLTKICGVPLHSEITLSKHQNRSKNVPSPLLETFLINFVKSGFGLSL